MEHIHEKARTKFSKVVLSSSPFFGALIAILLEVDEIIQAAILAFILGMLLYILSRDVIPKEEKGSPGMFVAGLTLTIIIWLIMIFIVV